MTTPAATAPLRVQRFRHMWLASIISNVGSFLQTVAGSWLMLQLTGSAFWVGAMVASSTLPLLFLALPAGVMADVSDRRRMLLIAQGIMAASALAMAAVVFLGLVTPPLLLGLGLVLGVGLALGLPSFQSIMPDLVPRDLVPVAISLNSASFNVARAIGPALGGLIVELAGPAWAFLANGLSYVGVMVALATFRGGAWQSDDETSLSAAMALGLRYARFTPAMQMLLLVASGFALTAAVVQSVLPSLSENVLRGGPGLYGTLLGAMGAGALLGAFTRERTSRLLGRRLVPFGIVLFGCAGVLVGLSRDALLTGAAMAVAGVAWTQTLSTLNATTQLLSPRWVRGRVMSLYTLAFVGVLPLGSMLAGFVADLVGVSAAYVGLSLGVVTLGLVALRLPLPVIGEFRPPEPAADYDPPEHHPEVAGGPILVLKTWIVDDERLDEFFAVMRVARVIRLRTGAFRWRLYRNVDDPNRLTEMYLVRSWPQHLRQERRLDSEAVTVLRHAETLDRDGAPFVRHLAAVDVTEPPLSSATLRGAHHDPRDVTVSATPAAGTPRGAAAASPSPAAAPRRARPG